MTETAADRGERDEGGRETCDGATGRSAPERETADRVLVTAATGTVGTHVVDELAGRDVVVRAATRDAETARAAGVDGDDREYVAFDFDRPETWGPALDAVDGVFLVRPPAVATDRLTAFVDAAGRVGVDRVAYLSTLGADRNPLVPHHRVERHLQSAAAEHGFASTLLRSSYFAQNLLEVHRPDLLERDELFVPAGAGRVSIIDARDVAAVAAVALVAEGGGNRAYDLTGPAALTFGEVAAVFTDVLGRRITYADPSVPAFVRRMCARDHPLGFVAVMVVLYTTIRLGFGGRVTDDVVRVLGREPRSMRTFVADHAAAFTPADRAGAS